jgi:nitrogen fixation NifU-like protein
MNVREDLYQQMILDYNRSPRNFRRMEHPTHQARGMNPLCGDEYTVFLNVDDGVIRDASFEGHGCAISKASASLMTQELKGLTLEQARGLYRQFHEMATGSYACCEHCPLGKLCVFSSVWKYPERVKCAVLAWRALEAALDGGPRASGMESTKLATKKESPPDDPDALG